MRSRINLLRIKQKDYVLLLLHIYVVAYIRGIKLNVQSQQCINAGVDMPIKF